MATLRERRRSRERLQRLSQSPLDADSLRLEAIEELQRVIGFDRWCWPLADPETLLPSGGLAEHDYVPAVPRALELEYTTDGFAAKHVLARRTNLAGSLSAETNGDLALSPRWDEVMRPVGIGDVATVACRDGFGCWGWVEAYRDRSDRSFDEDDLALLADVAADLGAALRRSVDLGGGRIAADPAGIVILDPAMQPVGWTAAGREWIGALPGASFLAQLGMLPSVVYPIAARARSGPVATDAHAILHTVDGRWVVVEAAPLEERDHEQTDEQTVITLRPPAVSEIFGVLCRSYGLTRRERQVVAHVATGLDTRAIAERMFVSPLTVQDHLKAVFQKAGVHSRRQLMASFRGSDSSGPDPNSSAESDAARP